MFACLYGSVLRLLQKPVHVRVATVCSNEFQIEGPEVMATWSISRQSITWNCVEDNVRWLLAAAAADDDADDDDSCGWNAQQLHVGNVADVQPEVGRRGRRVRWCFRSDSLSSSRRSLHWRYASSLSSSSSSSS